MLVILFLGAAAILAALAVFVALAEAKAAVRHDDAMFGPQRPSEEEYPYGDASLYGRNDDAHAIKDGGRYAAE